MSLSQKVAFNTLVQIFSKATTVIFGLLTTILLTGYLGREGYGNYMYVITLAIIFGSLADWGTMTIGVREAAKNRERQGRLLANLFCLRLILTFSAALLMALAAFLLPLQMADQLLVRQAILIGTLILILFATKASFGIVFQTNLRMEKLAVADITASGLILVFSWLFIRQQLGLLTLVSAVILANLVAVMIAWLLAKQVVSFDFRLDKVFIKQLIKESLPMGAILLMFTADNKIDTVMLGSIKGSGAVGIYAIAYRIYDVLILGAAYLMNSLLPVISRCQEKKKLRQIYQRVFDVLLVMGLGLMVVLWILAPLMVRILTQQRFLEFTDSVLVLRILSLALFLAYFNHLTGYTIVALGKQRPYFFIALVSLVFNIIANSMIIPRFSYSGAATVTILTEAIVLVMTTVFVYRLIKVMPSLVQFPRTILQLIKERGKIF